MNNLDELLDAVSFSAAAFLRASDWRQVVEPVLDRLGRAMHVTRVHLFRTIERRDGIIRSRQAYDWAVSPEWSERDLPELQDFTREEFGLPVNRPEDSDRVLEISLRRLPPAERERWTARGIKCGLAITLWVDGEQWGAIGLDDCFEDRHWTPQEHRALIAVSDALGAAIERASMEGQRRLLQRAVEQSPAAIVVTNPDGTIVYVNPRFTEVTGYTIEEAVGRHTRLLRSGKHSPEFYRQLWGTILRGEEWSGEMQNRRKDGSLIWEHVSISPVLDADGSVTHFVAVKEDITARRQLEEQLRQSQKMDAIGQLAGGVAHDFNNMLTAITGCAALLETEIDPEGAGPTYLAELQAAADRSAKLTGQLLAFSRKQVLSLAQLDLNDLVRQFDQMLKRVLPESVKLESALSTMPLPVKADAGQLEQVILNLAVNARDAMPQGGRLTIATRAVSEAGGMQWAEIEVRDTGIGMDPDQVARIFEPFYTTKPSGRGTGLGLSTVYGIVTQLGGRIDVQTQPGQGTAMHVRLPLLVEVTLTRSA